ncbi:MAG: 16S rRNA (guanine(527)-N(7))-methyltransferase RsmG [Deltaproteobacteria bacterium]|nr:16S rRNA (guanine(527)-N(7))-methyltransferase RsmG [Deltaproteobacteria bacterium]
MNPLDDPLQLLRRHGPGYGIELSEEQIRLFRIYLEELLQWNRRMNLTGMATPERIVNELFLDSLVPAPFLPGEGLLLDVGSGAGVPGLPLRIYHPRLEAHLLEPRAKRVSFLRQMIRILDLKGAEVLRGRLEVAGGGPALRRYPVVTARALASLSMSLSLCGPQVLPEGVLVCYQGSRVEALLDQCIPVLEAQHLVLQRTIRYSLPGKKGDRNVVIFRKRRVDGFPERPDHRP